MSRSRQVLVAIALWCAMLIGSLPPAMAADDLARATALMQRNDFAAAIPLLRQLADEGNGDAQAYLGGIYLAGLGGLPRDTALAGKWLRQAARQGNATAAFNLGLMAERGEGGLADFSGAKAWYEQAAYGGFPMAMLKLGEAYRNGSGTPIDLQRARQWLQWAAEAGLSDAQNLLGVMIAKGETYGSRVDAYAWFKIAARERQPEAEGNMDLLRPEMSDKEIAEADRQADAWLPMHQH